MSRITEIKVKEIQRISSQLTAKINMNKQRNISHNSPSMHIKSGDFNKPIQINNLQGNKILQPANINYNYRKEKDIEIERLKHCRLIPTKTETISLKTEFSPSGAGKLSKFIIKNNTSGSKYLSTKGISSKEIRIVSSNIISKTPQKYLGPKSEVKTEPSSPFVIKYPGERSPDHSRNVSKESSYFLGKSVSPISTNRVNMIKDHSKNKSNINNLLYVTPQNNYHFKAKEHNIIFRDNDDSFSAKEAGYNDKIFPQTMIDFDSGEKNAKDEDFFLNSNNEMKLPINQSLLSTNDNLAKGKGGKVQFYFSSPFKKNKLQLTKEGDLNKLILIQSMWKGHFLRLKLYNTLVRHYTGLAFINHFKTLKAFIKRDFFSIFFKKLRMNSNKINSDVRLCQNFKTDILNKRAIPIKIEQFSNLFTVKIEEFTFNNVKSANEIVKPYEFSFLGNTNNFRSPLIPSESDHFSLNQNIHNELHNCLRNLKLEDIDLTMKKEILNEYINKKITEFKIVSNSSLNFNIEVLNNKANDFSLFITNLNNHLIEDKTFGFSVINNKHFNPEIVKSEVKVEILNDTFSKENFLLSLLKDHNINDSEEIEKLIKLKHAKKDFPLIAQFQMEMEIKGLFKKNSNNNNKFIFKHDQEFSISPNIFTIKIKSDESTDFNDNINIYRREIKNKEVDKDGKMNLYFLFILSIEQTKQKLNDILSKRTKKTKIENPNGKGETKTLNYTKSSKIMGVAKLLEQQMLNRDNADTIAEKKKDIYANILLEKHVLKKKKPKQPTLALIMK